MESCPKCKSEKYVKLWDCQEVGNAKFKGWYCCECGHIEKPIGRENKFEFSGKEKS